MLQVTERACNLPPDVRCTIAVASSADGALFATSHGDHAIRIYSVAAGKTVAVLVSLLPLSTLQKLQGSTEADVWVLPGWLVRDAGHRRDTTERPGHYAFTASTRTSSCRSVPSFSPRPLRSARRTRCAARWIGRLRLAGDGEEACSNGVAGVR
jgi:hypothetical protein